MSLYKNYTTAFWDHAYSNTNITSYSCYETSYGNYKKLSVHDPKNSTMALQVMSSYSINNKYSIQQAQVFPVGHLRLIRFMATISGTAYEYLN